MSNDSNDDNSAPENSSRRMAIGVALGSVFDKPGPGIALGLVVGVVYGARGSAQKEDRAFQRILSLAAPPLISYSNS